MMITRRRQDRGARGRREARDRGGGGGGAPGQKAEAVARQQERRPRVAFAGDGINDAPALARRRRRHRDGDRHRRRHRVGRLTLVKGDSGDRPGAPSRARRCGTSGRTCSGRSSTTRRACRSRAGSLYPLLRPAALADARERRDELQLGHRDRERAAAQARAARLSSRGGDETAPAPGTGAPSARRGSRATGTASRAPRGTG